MTLKSGRLPVNLKWRFVELLLLSGEANEDGFLPDIPDMAWTLRCDETLLSSDLGQLAQAQLIELALDGEGNERWFVTKFVKRQAPSSGATRMREMRKRKKKEKKQKKKESRNKTKTYKNIKTDTDTYSDVTVVTKRNAPKHNTTQHKIIEKLVGFFIQETVCFKPQKQDELWLEKWVMPLKTMLEMCEDNIELFENIIIDSVDLMNEWNCTIASPASIKTAFSESLRKYQDDNEPDRYIEDLKRQGIIKS